MKYIITTGQGKITYLNAEVNSIKEAAKYLDKVGLNTTWALLMDKQKHPVVQFLKSTLDNQWYRTYLRKR